MAGGDERRHGPGVPLRGVAELDPQKLVERSPLTYVKNAKTPLLILRAEHDLRCPIVELVRHAPLANAGGSKARTTRT